MPEKNFSLKDQLFNEDKLRKIAGEIYAVYPVFAREKFVTDCLENFPQLELKERIVCISQNLENRLPSNYAEALEILLNALPKPCDPDLSDNDFGDFIYACYAEFVARFGCNAEFLQASLDALEQITMRFSAEYAIRNFINLFPEQTFEKLQLWCTHPHYHVRRLASEGTRPKLPWGKNISTPIKYAIPILNILHADTTRFVTRSVANHLNDLSKSNPDLVLELLEQWQSMQQQSEKELTFITKHALRTLVKNGNNKALKFIGFEQSPKVKLNVISISESVKMNACLSFQVELIALESVHILLDYGIYFQTQSGLAKKAKIYKFKQLHLRDGDRVILEKTHPLRGNMTTRRLHPGAHGFFIQVNGEVLYQSQFALVE